MPNAPIVWGLMLATLGQALAFMMLGAGHGWVTPFYFSPALFLVYPLAFIRMQAPERLPSRLIDLLLVVIAIALDVWLVEQTRNEGVEYYRRVMAAMPLFPMLWILVWLGWQWIALSVLIRGFLPRSRNRD